MNQNKILLVKADRNYLLIMRSLNVRHAKIAHVEWTHT